MRAVLRFIGISLLLLPSASGSAGDDKSGIDGEGFIQQWLVLAPIPLPPNAPAKSEVINAVQIKDEANFKPKAGDKLNIDGKVLRWRKKVTTEFWLDFNAFLGNQTDDSAAYAVSYIFVPKEQKGVKMKTGCDDYCKVYLNGQDVHSNTVVIGVSKDHVSTRVDLRQGINVLVAKVVNRGSGFGFCVRFTDQSDRPLMNLTAKAAP